LSRRVRQAAAASVRRDEERANQMMPPIRASAPRPASTHGQTGVELPARSGVTVIVGITVVAGVVGSTGPTGPVGSTGSVGSTGTVVGGWVGTWLVGGRVGGVVGGWVGGAVGIWLVPGPAVGSSASQAGPETGSASAAVTETEKNSASRNSAVRTGLSARRNGPPCRLAMIPPWICGV
jgi:hypothetical protein